MSARRSRPLPLVPGNDGYEVPVSRGQATNMDDDNPYESIPDHENSRKMVVKRLPRGVSTDTIEMFFESKRKMGRDLVVKHVELDSDNEEAVVTFASTSDVQYVVERHKMHPCELQKQTLVVEPLDNPDTVDNGASKRSSNNYSDMYESASPSDNDTDTVEVRNISDHCSDDTLTFYFENKRRSGGGEIRSQHMNREKGYARIQFEDKSVVKRVIEKGKTDGHKLDERELSVIPFVISKTELLLEEVPDTVNEENVSLFIEAKLKIGVISVVFNQDRSKVLVQLMEPVDFKRATDMLMKHKLDGVNVVPMQIPVSSGIVVTNLPEDTSNDSVEMYFENSKRSNGGPVRNVELHLDEGYCLVFFKDDKAVGRVCEKNDHTIHSQHVDVKPYNEYFGVSIESGGSSFQLPEPLSLKDIDPHKMKFLKENEKHRLKLEQNLAKCNGRLFFDDSPATIECTLTSHDKHYKKALKTWSVDVMDCVKQYTDDLQVTIKEVDFTFFVAIRRELDTLHLPNPDDLTIVMERGRSRIIFVAHKDVARSDLRKIERAIDSAEQEEKEKNEVVTQEKILDRWKIAYLKSSNFEHDVKHEYRNVQVTYEEKKEKGRIILSGPKAIITKVFIDMFESLQSVKSKDMDLDKEEIKLLQNDATRQKIKRQMASRHLSDVWEEKYDKVVLYADDNDTLAKMETVINNTLAKFTITLDSGKESVLKSDKWRATKTKLEDKFSGCFVISIHDTQLLIFTLADIQDEVSDDLKEFLSKNATYKEQLSLSPHVISCFKRVIRSSYDKEMNSLKDKGLNVKTNLNEKSVLIEGTSEGIKEAKSMIKRLQDKIEIKQHTIEQLKVKKYFDCSHGKDCVKNTESNIPCVIDMQGSAFKKSFHRNQSSSVVKFDKPTICAEAKLGSGIKVFVVGGDITELNVDVVVNAANTEMKHAGGLAAVIVNKGGRVIQSECDDFIRDNGALSEGEVFMSRAGNLKCKLVAHAVGPHWRGGDNGEERCLQDAVVACIEETDRAKLASIALPALSAGMFQYPVNLSCVAIVKAIDRHFQRSKSCVKEIYLCDISKATVCAFTNALQVVAPNLNVKVDLRQEDGQKQNWIVNNDDGDITGGRSSGSCKTIRIEVVKGELAKEQVDVIVNSTSPDLQLQKGALSKAILKSGGKRIQDECDQNYPNGIQVGEVAVSTAGKLQCSKIYHIAIKHFDSKSPRVCLQGLNECVTACLSEADKHGSTSISFPAMGTGAQKYPKDKVAKEMFKAVSTYGSKFPSSLIKNVRFVIYTQDDDTYESFVTEEKHWTGDNDHKPSPVIRKRSNSAIGTLVKESRGKAEFQIGKIRILIHDGDITEDDSEAIVASCNMDLDLSKGAVTKAILRKGGDAIEQDCKQQKSTMKKDGIAITTAGKLKAKYIIHVDTKYKTRDWPPVVLNCLKKAEKHKFPSVAFPALGTSVGCKPEDIAEVICMAINEFQKDSPVHLQKIKLIIFQSEMLSDFITGMKGSIVGRPNSAHGTSSDKQSHHSRRSHHKQHSSDQSDQSVDGHDPVEDSCTVTIYAENKDKIDKAVRALERKAKDEWIVKTIEDDEGVHRLSGKHIKVIKSKATDNHVDVHVDTDAGVIKVTGLVANVLGVTDSIHSQLRAADSSYYQKGHAKLMSSIVKWLYLKDQKECRFNDRVNLEIETAYKQKEKTVKVKDFSGGEYVIDFGTMQEHDVKKPNDKFPVIRRDLVAGASFDIPKHWRAMNDKDNLKLDTLNHQDAEYVKVQKEMEHTLGRKPSIVKIERIQNKTLYTQYSAKRKELNNNNKKDNEKVLWHGTADYAVASINSHGFNRSYCGKNATAIGQGVYFAVNANYSDQATYSPVGNDGNKRMYRCLVLTGKYCAGSSDMRVPPPIDRSKPHILYDSVTNNTSSPAMFVVFNDTQAYPEHIITYK